MNYIHQQQLHQQQLHQQQLQQQQLHQSIDPSSVVSQLAELKNIEKEIKRLSSGLKQLRDRKKAIEERVLLFLQNKNTSGAKTQDMVIMAKETVKRPQKPKDKKEHDVMQILHSGGVQNAKEMYETILNAMKGEEKIKQTLKIKDSNGKTKK